MAPWGLPDPNPETQCIHPSPKFCSSSEGPSDIHSLSLFQKFSPSLASQVAWLVKNPPANAGTWVWSPGQEDPLEEGMATCSTLAWRLPWTEEPGGLQSTASQSQTQLNTQLLKSSLLLLPGFLLLHTPSVLPIMNYFLRPAFCRKTLPRGSDHGLYHSLSLGSFPVPSLVHSPSLTPPLEAQWEFSQSP